MVKLAKMVTQVRIAELDTDYFDSLHCFLLSLQGKVQDIFFNQTTGPFSRNFLSFCVIIQSKTLHGLSH